ncbi:MAG: sulfotransferase family 2 domain-containing protein [Pseudomonadota bacterium]
MDLATKQMLRRLYERATFKVNVPQVCVHRGCVFVHIPRAAGSSLSLALFGCQVGHRKLKEYQLGRDRRMNDLLKFTVCRNPIDRAYSGYRFLKAGGLTKSDENWAKKHHMANMSFDGFVRDVLVKESGHPHVHFIPQFEFVERYAYGPVGVDVICRYENLAKEVGEVARTLGLKLDLEHLNASPSSDGPEHDPATLAALKKLYARDFYLFGYSL